MAFLGKKARRAALCSHQVICSSCLGDRFMGLVSIEGDKPDQAEFDQELVLTLQNSAGLRLGFGSVYARSLNLPIAALASQLEDLNNDVEVYGQLQTDFEDLGNALRSHANDQTFQLTDSYRNVFEKSIKAYEKKLLEPGLDATAKKRYRDELAALRDLYSDIQKGEKIPQHQAAGGSALILEAKGWVIPADKSRDVLSTKAKFLNDEFQQLQEQAFRLLESQYSQ